MLEVLLHAEHEPVGVVVGAHHARGAGAHRRLDLVLEDAVELAHRELISASQRIASGSSTLAPSCRASSVPRLGLAVAREVRLLPDDEVRLVRELAVDRARGRPRGAAGPRGRGASVSSSSIRVRPWSWNANAATNAAPRTPMPKKSRRRVAKRLGRSRSRGAGGRPATRSARGVALRRRTRARHRYRTAHRALCGRDRW